MLPDPHVWVFNAARATFPGGVFTTRARAEAWIAKHQLSGTLTAYPIDMSVMDWGYEVGAFAPGKFDNKMDNARFVGGFSSGVQEHYHYENGTQGHSIDP
ncbi:MAG: hypothetical protein AAFQ53_01385 [Bacteroidota bacterium]